MEKGLSGEGGAAATFCCRPQRPFIEGMNDIQPAQIPFVQPRSAIATGPFANPIDRAVRCRSECASDNADRNIASPAL
jgi:hypothetical protein